MARLTSVARRILGPVGLAQARRRALLVALLVALLAPVVSALIAVPVLLVVLLCGSSHNLRALIRIAALSPTKTARPSGMPTAAE